MIQHPEVSEAFLNMKASAVPDGSNANKQLVTSLHPEGYDPPTKSSLAYRHHHMHTIITLPVYELGSKENEEIWIDLTINKIVDHMRDIFISAKFQKLYKRLAIQNPCSQVASAHRPKHHSTLPKYIKNTSVRIHPITSLTKHFTRPVANAISQQLSNARLHHLKYDSDESVASKPTGSVNRKDTSPQKFCPKKRARHTEECSTEKTTWKNCSIPADDVV